MFNVPCSPKKEQGVKPFNCGQKKYPCLNFNQPQEKDQQESTRPLSQIQGANGQVNHLKKAKNVMEKITRFLWKANMF